MIHPVSWDHYFSVTQQNESALCPPRSRKTMGRLTPITMRDNPIYEVADELEKHGDEKMNTKIATTMQPIHVLPLVVQRCLQTRLRGCLVISAVVLLLLTALSCYNVSTNSIGGVDHIFSSPKLQNLQQNLHYTSQDASELPYYGRSPPVYPSRKSASAHLPAFTTSFADLTRIMQPRPMAAPVPAGRPQTRGRVLSSHA